MKEQRKSPRISKVLPIKFSKADFDILTETINISSSGAYCSISKPLDLMTKLNTILLITLIKNKTKTVKKINCSAIVVRLDHLNDNQKYPYRIGIYFNDLKEKDRKILKTYINA